MCNYFCELSVKTVGNYKLSIKKITNYKLQFYNRIIENKQLLQELIKKFKIFR
jgi:hypothetical protein